MKVKDLLTKLQNTDPELDVYFSDPDRSSIVYPFDGCGEVVTVQKIAEFGDGEHFSHDFPIGYKFLKLC